MVISQKKNDGVVTNTYQSEMAEQITLPNPTKPVDTELSYSLGLVAEIRTYREEHHLYTRHEIDPTKTCNARIAY
jgi:hypothetical protein